MKAHKLENKDSYVFEFDLTGKIDCNKTRNDIVQFRKDHPRPRKSTINSWHSGFFTHRDTDIFNPLINLVEESANSIGKILIEMSVVDISFKVKESWAIIYDKYGYTEEHMHHPLCFSSVFYASADNCASIKFGDYEIETKTGMLLIFPGYLKHSVPAKLPKHSERIAYVSNLYPEMNFDRLETMYTRLKEDQ